MWDMALDYRGRDNDDTYKPWRPNTEAAVTLVSAYMGEASTVELEEEKMRLYQKVVDVYSGVLNDIENEKGFHYIDAGSFQQNQRGMLNVLQAVVSLEGLLNEDDDESEDCQSYQEQLRNIAREIATLECLRAKNPFPITDPNALRALSKAKSWISMN